MVKETKVLVSVADGKALALTGLQRGEVWIIDEPPADGFWIVGVMASVSYAEARWRGWSRPTEAELLAYHRYIVALGK
jgi:hypothetical protein